ncbi:MAG: hypothetical protein ACI39C_13420 [Dietzia sp.]
MFKETLSPISAVESGLEQAALAAPAAERLPAHTASIVRRLDRENLGLNFSPLVDPATRAMANQFAQLLSLSVLTVVAAFSGIALVLSDQGPQWADGLNMTTYLGLVLLLVAYVLGSRLVIMPLGHELRHSAQPGDG